MPSEDLAALLRWEDSGGAWEVLSRRGDRVEVALLTCARDERMGLLRSRAADLTAYLERSRPDREERG
jgi:hypothetical protein